MTVKFFHEILEKTLWAILEKNQMNLMKIWKNNLSKETRKFIKKTNCNCTYECALSYNILGNWRYHQVFFPRYFFKI